MEYWISITGIVLSIIATWLISHYYHNKRKKEEIETISETVKSSIEANMPADKARDVQFTIIGEINQKIDIGLISAPSGSTVVNIFNLGQQLNNDNSPT